MQDSAVGLVKAHTFGLSSLIQPVQIPLLGLPTLRQINIYSQPRVISLTHTHTRCLGPYSCQCFMLFPRTKRRPPTLFFFFFAFHMSQLSGLVRASLQKMPHSLAMNLAPLEKVNVRGNGDPALKLRETQGQPPPPVRGGSHPAPTPSAASWASAGSEGRRRREAGPGGSPGGSSAAILQRRAVGPCGSGGRRGGKGRGSAGSSPAGAERRGLSGAGPRRAAAALVGVAGPRGARNVGVLGGGAGAEAVGAQ